jgi:O-antigen ligase
MFQTKPYFGWGYETFDLYDRQFQERVADMAHDNKDHASHNMYLTLLAEQGLVGLLLFLAPAGWWLVMSIRRWPTTGKSGFWSRKLLLILWLAILSQLLLNSFSNLRVTYGLGLWWIALALVAHFLRTQPLTDAVREVAGKAPAVWHVVSPRPLTDDGRTL